MSRHKFIVYLFFLSSIGVMVFSCQDPGKIEQDMYYSNGRDLYIQHCQNCHGTNAEGLEALVPPLTDTVYLKQNKSNLACIIKNGLSGSISVNGESYDEKMPENPDLAAIDIAQLIVYITNSWRNKQGMYQTSKVAADLNNCK